MDNNLVIYSGFPKTGSQWVLNSLWKEDGSGFDLIADGDTVARDFIRNNPFEFNPVETRARYESRLRGSTKKTIPVIHHEGISARLFAPAPPNIIPFQQLAVTFPGCKVILAIREQRDLLLSWYRHNVRAGLAVSLEKFLTENVPEYTPYFCFEAFRFDRLVEYLYRLFQKENVLVIPYELLRHDPSRYLDRVYAFSGARSSGFTPAELKINIGLDPLETVILARLNRLFVTEHPIPRRATRLKCLATRATCKLYSLAPQSLHSATESRMRRIIDDRIKDRYNQSNKALQKITGLELDEYGYAL